jgi:hypothetical protein
MLAAEGDSENSAAQAARYSWPCSATGASTPIHDRRAEVDLQRFPRAKHLASWAGMCSGNKESGGKRLSEKTRKGNVWLRQVLIEVVYVAFEYLGRLIDRLLVYGPLTTSMVLSTPIQRRAVTREAIAAESKQEDTAPEDATA